MPGVSRPAQEGQVRGCPVSPSVTRLALVVSPEVGRGQRGTHRSEALGAGWACPDRDLGWRPWGGRAPGSPVGRKEKRNQRHSGLGEAGVLGHLGPSSTGHPKSSAGHALHGPTGGAAPMAMTPSRTLFKK